MILSVFLFFSFWRFRLTEGAGRGRTISSRKFENGIREKVESASSKVAHKDYSRS